MDYGTQQLIFLIILLGVMAAVVIGTFVFTTLVDRFLESEGAQEEQTRDRRNEEQAADESISNEVTDWNSTEDKS